MAARRSAPLAAELGGADALAAAGLVGEVSIAKIMLASSVPFLMRPPEPGC